MILNRNAQKINFGGFFVKAPLREVARTRALRKTYPGLQWFYMGFYVHSCPKMRYKAAFPPSYLLCPEAYTWHPIEKCILLIGKSKYTRLDPDSEKSDPNFIEGVSKVLVLNEKYAVPYRHYLRILQNDPEQHAKLVGEVLAERLDIFRFKRGVLIYGNKYTEYYKNF